MEGVWRVNGLSVRGWQKFAAERVVADWVAHALPVARCAVSDPRNKGWLQCDGTWFVGVDVLDNDAEGRIGGSDALSGTAVEVVRDWLGYWPSLHRGQVSVVYSGYPRPRKNEGEKAFQYRVKRDAAHVDGVLAEGPKRRRHVRQPHAFILGLPLVNADSDASPLVVWEGSHTIMREAFREVFAGHSPASWTGVDVTESYLDARRKVFMTCRRVVLPARPGEAVLLHPLTLHGIAPWRSAAQSGPDGRMVVYFRPELSGGVSAWLGGASWEDSIRSFPARS